MENLVIMKGKQAVTTSLNIAENFDKQHKHVLRDIENLLEEDRPNFGQMFVEGTDPDSYGRPRKTYFMNRDGFSFLAMGFTGSKAREFKMKYINAFNEMEQMSKQPPSNTKLLLRASLEHEEKIETLEIDVEGLKKEIDLSRLQKSKLSKLVRANAMAAVGGKKSNAYSELYRVAISEHWREIKNYFEVASYEEIPKLKFEEAMEIAGMWTPSLELAMNIKHLNTQSETEV